MVTRFRTAGAVVVAAGLLAASCSNNAGGGNEAADGGPGGDGADRGVFVHALGGEPETLDPAQATDGGYGNRAIVQVYEFLVDLPPDSAEPVPMLATEVPTQENGLVSDDGLTYTFPIREGVTFHDGTELTAEDVEYSWDRVMTMDLPEGQASRLTDVIESMRAVDDHTFEVTLVQPASWFLTTVAYSPPAAIVSQDAVEGNGGVVAGEPNEFMTSDMVGTGPHRFVSWERNDHLSFEVFDDYWGEPAQLDARWEVVTDNSVMVLGLQAGDYDLVEPTPQFVTELQGTENVCSDDSGFLLEPLHLAFNLDIPVDRLPGGDTIPADFFWDPRVRQAFNYAFDFEGFVNAGLAGFGATATYLPPGVLGHDPDAPRYSQDLARAEELFRETGWWDEGFTVSVIVEENNPTFSAVALILKDSLESLNPEFRVDVLEVAETQFDEAHGTTPFEYAMWVKNADPFTDPHQFMWTYHHPDGEWGTRLGYRNGYQDPDAIADLIDRAALSTDVEEREQLYGELLRLVHEDPMWIWAGDEANVQIYQCDVTGFVYNPLWVMPRWRFYGKA